MRCPTKLQPLLSWPGGKRRTAPKLIELFPEHETYVSPMAGGAAVFFAKPPARRTILSDADRWLMRFYADVRSGRLRSCQGGILASRGLFERSKSRTSACHKLALNKLSYHGDRRTYGARSLAGKVLLAQKLRRLPCYEDKLREARLFAGDFEAVMRHFDGPKALHFLDPPWPLEYSDRYHGFTRPRHRKSWKKSAFNGAMDPKHIRQVSEAMKGAVVLVYNDSPGLRALFEGRKGWTTKRIRVHRNVRGRGAIPDTNLVAIKKARGR